MQPIDQPKPKYINPPRPGRFLLEQRGLRDGGSRVGGAADGGVEVSVESPVESSVEVGDNSAELWDACVRWQLVAENTTDIGQLLRKMGGASVHGLPGVHTTSIIAEGLSTAKGPAGRRIARHFLAALATVGGSGGSAAAAKSAVMVAAREAVLGVGTDGGANDGTASEDELATLLPRARRSNFHRSAARPTNSN